ncbi:MAG: hypothetical protein IKX51_03245, partial [Bacteroidales bacterium]|nr:hypothetical protein [Bacteroidales bacterium]
MKSFFAKLLSHLSLAYKVAAIIATALLILLVFPNDEKKSYDFDVNGFWKGNDLYAPYDFPIMKSEEKIEAERQNAKKSGLLFFRTDTTAQAKAMAQIGALSLDARQKPAVLRCVAECYAQGVIEQPDDAELQGRNIVLLDGNIGRERQADAFVTQSQIALRLCEIMADTVLCGQIAQAVLPNIVFDKDRTRLEQESMLAQVSTTEGMVSAGELIISKGEFISPEKARIISSLDYEEVQKRNEHYSVFNHNLGQFLLTIIALVTLFLFLRLIRHPLLSDNKKVTFVLFVILLMAVLTSMIVRVNPDWTLLVPL